MNFNNRSRAILFLRRDGFDFYEDKSGRILLFPLSRAVVSSMEIINIEEFKKQIKAFIEVNQILAADIMVVLSADVLFEKDIQGQDPDVQTRETQRFLDMVPFDSISSKLLPGQGGARIIAVNRNFIDALKISFQENEFLIGGVIPYEALGESLWGINSLNLESSRAIIGKFESLRGAGFDSEKNEKKTVPKAELQESGNKAKSPRVYIMLGVFGLLLVILILLLVIGTKTPS